MWFRRALHRDPGDALTRLWYGNMLSDRGDHAAALVELDRARLRMPGSVAIRTDHGWALWAAAREAQGIAILRDVARRHPDFAVAHDCLATIALIGGDLPGDARHFDRFARLRGERRLLVDAATIAAAARIDPAAVRAVAVGQATARLAGDAPDPALAMLVPAQANRWPAVHDRLRRAALQGERWGEAGLLDRLAAQAPDAAAMRRLLAPRRL